MKRELTTQDVMAIEQHIDEIDRELDILDASNAIEAQEIERKTCVLESYLQILQGPEPKSKLSLVI